MSFLKEFREFAMRGNVVDLAVGVIIGAAFGKIVSSLVADIIMPPLGLLIGGIDFKQFAVTLRDAQGDVPAVVMHYGVFIQNVFDFIIVAFAIFMAIKLMNKLNRKKEEAPAAPPAPSKEEVLLSEIRDLLKRTKQPFLISRESRRPVVKKRFACLPLASRSILPACLSLR
ncbi:large-conductance mechanosensitive channel [Klebsiella pneumoniae subsp. pneumoniae KpMDU1]|nr:large-conductance mechanosensitive channel [Klebsiella pneumoniae subsp. pneumoniae KpMDU1]